MLNIKNTAKTEIQLFICKGNGKVKGEHYINSYYL